jgi:CheY-like chemotaxis protein
MLLVVENEPNDWLLLQRAFQRVGIDASLRHVPNGHEAVRLLYKERPRCILLDLKMPMMNGFQLIEHVRSIDALKSLPIVVLSASENENDRERAFQSGANDYLVKPGSFDELVDVIRGFRDRWLTHGPDAPEAKESSAG